MTSYERGDIVLVPFPFSDQTTSKKRPAVIISSDTYNSLSADCVIMAVTSQTSKVSSVGECLIIDYRRTLVSLVVYIFTNYMVVLGTNETRILCPVQKQGGVR